MSSHRQKLGILEKLEKGPQPKVALVPMGEFQFVSFSQMTAIGTRNLGSCSVVLIASQYGAILAHIPPLPSQASSSASTSMSLDPYAGDNNVRALMDQVKQLYHYYQSYNYFPASNAHIVCAIFQGEVALPDQVAIMKESCRWTDGTGACYTHLRRARQSFVAWPRNCRRRLVWSKWTATKSLCGG